MINKLNTPGPESNGTPDLHIPVIFSGERGWEATQVINFSGYEGADQYQVETNLRPWLQHLAGEADKLVVYPDVSPTEMGVLIPTGVAAEFDIERTPDYLKFFKGADVGCGMFLAQLGDSWSKEAFQENPDLLDKLYAQMKRHSGEFALGGGNHFLDFAYDLETDQVNLVVHTGSFGDLQLKLKDLHDKPNEYWYMYDRTIESAIKNRRQIAEVVASIYGDFSWSSDTIHNSIDRSQAASTGKVRVYKGVIQVTDKSTPLILPSSANGLMALYMPGEGINDETLNGTSHGTGRRIKRGDAKGDDFIEKNDLRVDISGRVQIPELMIPKQLSGVPLTESPVVYYPIDRSELIMTKYGLMRPDARFLQAFAYIGHM